MRWIFLFTFLCSPALAQPIFDAVDTNNDDVLSRTEFEQERRTRIKMMDANSDNVITRSELFERGARYGLNTDQIQAFLTHYDIDQNGDIELWEIEKIESMTTIFDNLDLDKDGVITREEASSVFDVRKGEDLSPREIVSDLTQGLRQSGGFKAVGIKSPVKIPSRQAPSTPTPDIDSRPVIALDSQGLVPFDERRQIQDATPRGRSGLVGRSRVTTSPSLNRFYSDQQPPERRLPYRSN